MNEVPQDPWQWGLVVVVIPAVRLMTGSLIQKELP